MQCMRTLYPWWIWVKFAHCLGQYVSQIKIFFEASTNWSAGGTLYLGWWASICFWSSWVADMFQIKVYWPALLGLRSLVSLVARAQQWQLCMDPMKFYWPAEPGLLSRLRSRFGICIPPNLGSRPYLDKSWLSCQQNPWAHICKFCPAAFFPDG